MDLFAEEHLVPFVEDVMTMEAVAMAIEGAKVHVQEGEMKGSLHASSKQLPHFLPGALTSSSLSQILGQSYCAWKRRRPSFRPGVFESRHHLPLADQFVHSRSRQQHYHHEYGKGEQKAQPQFTVAAINPNQQTDSAPASTFSAIR